MPTYLLLELTGPVEVNITPLAGGAARRVLPPLNSLAAVAHALDMLHAGKPLEGAIDAEVSRLTETKPGPGAVAVGQNSRTGTLKAYVDERPPRDHEYVNRVVDEMRAERNRAQPFGQPEDMEPVPPMTPEEIKRALDMLEAGRLHHASRTPHPVRMSGFRVAGPAYHGDPGDAADVPHTVGDAPFPSVPATDDPDEDTDELMPLPWPVTDPPGGSGKAG